MILSIAGGKYTYIEENSQRARVIKGTQTILDARDNDFIKCMARDLEAARKRLEFADDVVGAVRRFEQIRAQQEKLLQERGDSWGIIADSDAMALEWQKLEIERLGLMGRKAAAHALELSYKENLKCRAQA